MAETMDSKLTRSEFRQWLIEYVAVLLGLDESAVDPQLSFDLYGLDSTAAVGLSGDLSDLLEHKIETTIAYDYSTIDALVERAHELDLLSTQGHSQAHSQGHLQAHSQGLAPELDARPLQAVESPLTVGERADLRA